MVPDLDLGRSFAYDLPPLRLLADLSLVRGFSPLKPANPDNSDRSSLSGNLIHADQADNS
jgi:hypothetical protein